MKDSEPDMRWVPEDADELDQFAYGIAMPLRSKDQKRLRESDLVGLWRNQLRSLDRTNKRLVERIFQLEEFIRSLGAEPPER